MGLDTDIPLIYYLHEGGFCLYIQASGTSCGAIAILQDMNKHTGRV
jgi:hypothetical protein